jgi:hypothetical protein
MAEYNPFAGASTPAPTAASIAQQIAQQANATQLGILQSYVAINSLLNGPPSGITTAQILAAMDALSASNPAMPPSANVVAAQTVAKAFVNMVVPGTISDSTPSATITLPG